MEDILMVKPDNSRATKTGHFYLSLTQLPKEICRNDEVTTSDYFNVYVSLLKKTFKPNIWYKPNFQSLM